LAENQTRNEFRLIARGHDSRKSAKTRERANRILDTKSSENKEENVGVLFNRKIKSYTGSGESESGCFERQDSKIWVEKLDNVLHMLDHIWWIGHEDDGRHVTRPSR
jgi:hypothetical protein